ncbi:hypothetical protein CYQ65_12530, partial [Enterococcus faecium]
LESSYELVAKLILKDFRVSFLYFFYTKKMLVKFTNIKKYRAQFLSQPFLPSKRCSPANSSITSHNIHKT